MRRFLSVMRSEGVVGAGDMAVAQRGAGANMSVDIAAGEALVQGDLVTNQGLYYTYNDAVYNLTGFAAANATNPRVDRVVLKLDDLFHGGAANTLAPQIVTGTATAGATLANLTGAATVPASSLLLANVLVPATATTITTGNIDTTVRTSVYAGVISNVGLWQTYTPAWTSSGTAPSLGNGAITGSYTQTGKTVNGFVALTMGSTTTFGTGTYSFSLPTASSDPGSALGLTYITDISAASVYVYATILVTTTTVGAYSMAAPAAAATNLAPVTFASGDSIVARFTYRAS